MKQSQEVIVKQEAQTIAERATTLQVTTPEQAKEATEFLSQANKKLDALTAIEEQITAPANLIIKNERARWAEPKKMLKTTIDLLRTKLGQYQTQALKAKAEADAKIAARVAPGKGNLSVETAISKMAENAAPEKKVEVESGSLSFRATPTLKITDASIIPGEYLVPDEDKIFADLKAGKKVPGAEIEIVQTPINHR